MIEKSHTPITNRIITHKDRTAIIDEDGRHSYLDLLSAAENISATLLKGEADLNQSRVAFMTPPDFSYAATLLGIWLAGGIAVPLALSHPLPEIEYVVTDTSAETILYHPEFEQKLQPLAHPKKLNLEPTQSSTGDRETLVPYIDTHRRAMILYTSGTTSAPKGVVTTHANITAQIEAMIEAWEWRAEDHILNVLPLHHTHGIINVLCSALWAGATCEMMPKFNAGRVWKRFIDSDISLFMAVPTIYVKLLEHFNKASSEEQQAMSAACRRMRLMVSGSAALPARTFTEFESISGHRLLERYGMTETGMILGNPLRSERRPGYVGVPFPDVEVKLVSETGEEISGDGTEGEILVQGPGVFAEYWNKPAETAKAFRGGWFATGDIAVLESGYYRILGRKSVDILKTGGYKVSALQIEAALLQHPQITACAVVGIPDPEWGERISVAIETKDNTTLSLEDIREWSRKHLAPYKIPTRLLIVDELPRNAMGKTVKTEIRNLFSPD